VFGQLIDGSGDPVEVGLVECEESRLALLVHHDVVSHRRNITQTLYNVRVVLVICG
jgi:hypothetical protein